QAAHDQRVVQIMGELAQGRRELADSQREVDVQRRRVFNLRRRLKCRFHRHWAAERKAIRLREAEVANQRRALNEESERLRREKAALIQACMKHNGDQELSRRRWQAAWKELRQEQVQLLQRTNALQQRETILERHEREQAEERRHWEEARLRLRQEAQG